MIYIISSIRGGCPYYFQTIAPIKHEEQAMTTTQLETLTIKEIVTQSLNFSKPILENNLIEGMLSSITSRWSRPTSLSSAIFSM